MRQSLYVATYCLKARESLTTSDSETGYCKVQYIYSKNIGSGVFMATDKTSTLTFRIEPALKEALSIAAAREHRSIANMVAVMIREHCGRNGIAIQEQAPLLEKTSRVQARNR